MAMTMAVRWDRLLDASALLERGDWESVAAQWLGVPSFFDGKRVRVGDDSGTVDGLDAFGRLCIRTATGILTVDDVTSVAWE